MKWQIATAALLAVALLGTIAATRAWDHKQIQGQHEFRPCENPHQLTRWIACHATQWIVR